VWSHSRRAYIWKRIPESLRITPRGGSIRLNDSANGFRRAHWWGSFRIIRTGGTLTLVDAVGLDRYAASVAACEVPSDWPSQALRAEAVVSRSYALATKNPGGLFDAYPDTRSQSACPVEHVSERIARAADATRRRVVTYHGHVATTFYSSSSGGRTSSISASWGGTDLPYLVPVRDRYDRAGGHNPNHTWEAVGYRPRRLAAQLGLSHRVTRVDPTIDRASRRVLRLTVQRALGLHEHLAACHARRVRAQESAQRSVAQLQNRGARRGPAGCGRSGDGTGRYKAHPGRLIPKCASGDRRAGPARRSESPRDRVRALTRRR
jgi:SpoIID/LytB domain protein